MIKIEVQSTRAVIRYQEPLTVGLRGAKAHFVFGDGWDGLVKTAVFRQGDKTVAVADIDAEVTVPWEVLTQPGLPVQIGVYGTNGSQVAIPTLWAVTQPVRPGTDPEADPSTEPTPGLWEQMQGKLDNLEASVNEASRAVKVTITQNADGSYTADRYCDELLDAYNAGYTVYCQYGSRVFPLLLAARSQVAFGCVYADQTHTVMIGRQSASVVSKTLAAGDGITPHIGANGNWFIGETDTGMPSRGEDAPQEAILYTPQDLTHEQQTQVRQNIGAIEAPETAQVGQTIRVKSVDENNKPTEWEAVDFPTGGGSSNVFHFTVEVEEDAVEEFTIELPTTYENILMFNVHITFGTIEQDFTLYSGYGENSGMTFDIKTANLVNGEPYGANVYSVRYYETFFTHHGSQNGYTYAAYPGIGGRLNVKNMNSNTVGFYTRPYGVSIPKGTKFEIWGLCK